MKKRNQPKPERQKASRRSKPPGRARTYALILACTLLIVSGFFFAGRQHFASMDFGMKNSRLRKQVDELEAEKRRLLLAREVSLSPAEIKKAARKTGMVDLAALETENARTTPADKGTTAVPAAATEPKLKPLVIKTAAVAETASRPALVITKTDKFEKHPKKQAAAE